MSESNVLTLFRVDDESEALENSIQTNDDEINEETYDYYEDDNYDDYYEDYDEDDENSIFKNCDKFKKIQSSNTKTNNRKSLSYSKGNDNKTIVSDTLDLPSGKSVKIQTTITADKHLNKEEKEKAIKFIRRYKLNQSDAAAATDTSQTDVSNLENCK